MTAPIMFASSAGATSEVAMPLLTELGVLSLTGSIKMSLLTELEEKYSMLVPINISSLTGLSETVLSWFPLTLGEGEREGLRQGC